MTGDKETNFTSSPKSLSIAILNQELLTPREKMAYFRSCKPLNYPIYSYDYLILSLLPASCSPAPSPLGGLRGGCSLIPNFLKVPNSMTASRLILLLAVILILTILLVQNWSPVLSLVFLGMKTQPLPLAIWIILSITTGALTSWLIATLHQLSNYLGSQKQPTPSPRSYRAPRVQQDTRQEATFNTANVPKTPRKQDSKTQVIEDDWDTYTSEDWDFDELAANQSTQSSQNKSRREPRDYERPQQSTKPANSNQSDSVYSYSSREPKNTGVGKTESVYDADYRVIVPPYQPSPKNQQIDDDDWDFLDDDGEDDDFDDDERFRR